MFFTLPLFLTKNSRTDWSVIPSFPDMAKFLLSSLTHAVICQTRKFHKYCGNFPPSWNLNSKGMMGDRTITSRVSRNYSRVAWSSDQKRSKKFVETTTGAGKCCSHHSFRWITTNWRRRVWLAEILFQRQFFQLCPWTSLFHFFSTICWRFSKKVSRNFSKSCSKGARKTKSFFGLMVKYVNCTTRVQFLSIFV